MKTSKLFELICLTFCGLAFVLFFTLPTEGFTGVLHSAFALCLAILFAVLSELSEMKGN